MRKVRVIVVDYDGGTKVPGSGGSSPAWHVVLEDLPISLRAHIAGQLTISRSLGRYIPSMVRFAIGDCLRDGLSPLLLGGDHSLSYATAWAARECVGTLAVVHADAHHDSYQVPYLSNYSFAYHAGRDFGHQWHGVGWRHEPDQLRSRRLEYDVRGPSWLSFDFDYFDPEIFPAVRFPVPGPGGTPEDLDATIDRMKGPLLGVDLLEWMPAPGAENSDLVMRTVVRALEAVLR
ncbi:arginase family protein [Nonomuraea zeae]|uniref:Arginase family protein n=1 Tax=Nonomuraea zeae TaxID=1642303 RepID=A0A5S4FVE3_9ACTN|nr:arginase family protein [Nonomuraea zeae]TMR24747.1 hypothetical protein ETD85_46190 [Nonomuraea zeae]